MSVVLVEKQTPQITILTLNRPERRNALTIELMTELVAAIQRAQMDQAQRVLVLRGAGEAFCAGLDLKETAEMDKAHTSAEMVAKTLVTLSETRLITVAAVHGAAVAGGAGIMSTCDFVIAAHHTKIGYPEVRRGLVAGLVMTFLRRQVRERDIRELLLGSELIDAARAQAIGLVNRVVAAEHVNDEIEKIVANILQGAPDALAKTKRLLADLWPSSIRQDVERALSHHLKARESAEAKEGIAAFAEKRPPAWVK